MLDIEERIRKEKFIGILRNVPLNKTEAVADAMYRGGIRIFEVTYNPSESDTVDKVSKQLEIIKGIHNDAAFCVGTVVFPEFVEAAHKAGASAIVSPTTDCDIIKLTKKMGMLSMPGAFTPSEINYAYNCGADIVKIFPILPTDITYLKTVMSPLSHIPFITTGGVNPSTIPLLLSAGAAAVAAGATIIPPDALKNDDYVSIQNNAEAHISALQ